MADTVMKTMAIMGPAMKSWGASLRAAGQGMMVSEADREAARLIANLQKRAVAQEAIARPPLKKGDVAMYEHRQFGSILVEVVGVDFEGAHDGGVTYVIAAPELDGVIETTRSRLRLNGE